MRLNTEAVFKGIEQAIKQAVEDEIEHVLKDAEKRLNDRRAEIIGSISVRLFRHLNFDRMGDDLVIRIENRNNE